MARSNPNTRIVLHLDPRIALEAILLNRLERTPTNRRPEWLRSLLIAGFRAECDALRHTTDLTTRGMTALASTWNTRTARQSLAATPSMPLTAAAKQVSTAQGNKPFAALAHVIGQTQTAHRALTN